MTQAQHPIPGGRFLRVTDVIAETGLSRATIYRLIAARDFPPQRQLSPRCVGWWQADVEKWKNNRLHPTPPP